MTMAEQVADCSKMIPWRRSQLRRAGFSRDLAGVVAADLRYDLGEMLMLVDRGCPPRLAVRILAPLSDSDEVPA